MDLADFILTHGLEAEIVAPEVPMPTVATAAAPKRVVPGQILQSIRLNNATVQDVIQDSERR